MPSKFVRLDEADFQIAINIERINSVIRTGDIVVIYFTDNEDQSRLTGSAAEAFWSYIKCHSIGIYRAPHTEANPETVAQQDIDQITSDQQT